MSPIAQKPRVAFFQFRYLDRVTQFQLIHRNEHVKCLEQFFAVTIINEDCDYQQVCNTVEPDLAIFETGLEILDKRRLKIANVRNSGGIPKIALLNSDGCSQLRPAILSDIDHWGIETLFSISLVAGDHLQGVADRLYVWPNFIDPTVFRDYGQPKSVPVLLTGSLNSRYPWRNGIRERILGRIPTLWYPHPGYTANGSQKMIVGGEYARLINSSKVALACGSVSHELVRKHLEIPASLSCLVTERSPAVEAAGFVDLMNCVYATPADVVDKLDYLLSNEATLAEITSAGHELVHTRHTILHRKQIFDWFELNRSKSAQQKILQPDPFGSLSLSDEFNIRPIIRISSRGAHLVECASGDRLFAQGDCAEAERAFRRCLTYLSEFPEAKFKIAYCRLRVGDARGALSWIIQPLWTSLVGYGAEDPDPVEWACFILVLVCLGKLRKAARRASQFPELRHLELDRVRWLVGCLRSRGLQESACPCTCDSPRLSIHTIPQREPADWIADCCSILRICAQEHLANLISTKIKPVGSARSLRKPIAWTDALLRPKRPKLAWSLWRKVGMAPEKATFTGLDHPLLLSAVSSRMRSAARATFSRFGLFSRRGVRT